MTARYLSVAQIAEELGIPLSTAYERVKGMRHILVGKHIRVSRQALDAWPGPTATGSGTLPPPANVPAWPR